MSTLFLIPAKGADETGNAIGMMRGNAEGDLLFAPDLQAAEVELLVGDWGKQKLYFEALLPAVRAKLQTDILPRVENVHIDLGDEISTLYAAYYTAIERKPYSVSVHRPGIGGPSFWSQNHPLVIRKLAMVVLARAETVFVPTKDVAQFLIETLPRIQRQYIQLPITQPRISAQEIARLDSLARTV